MKQPSQRAPMLIEPRGACLEITNRRVGHTGYIYVKRNGVLTPYHRTVWEQHNGPLSPKQVVRQTCGNRRCCNIRHLALGTHAQDIAFVVNDVGCHICTSHKPCQYGYPQGRDKVHSTGQTEYLHRIVWKRNFGGIAPGLVVRHKCDNRLCVNPAHLELGTMQENTRDMVERGRNVKGVSSGMAKRTEEEIRAIRKLLAEGARQVDIAAQFNMQQTNVSSIKLGKLWAHVV